MIEYSRGYRGIVFVNEGKGLVFFSSADLVKTEQTKNPFEGLRTFYLMQLTHLLFPDNFIDVVGLTKQSKKSQDGFIYNNSFFSRKASVPKDHAVYSQHGNKHIGEKSKHCLCDICKRHDFFHGNKDFHDKALDLASFLKCEAGIFVPESDPTDYCLDDSGHIIFFEVDKLRHDRAKIYIEKNLDVTRKWRAYDLLERFTKYDESWMIFEDIYGEDIIPEKTR